MVRFLHTGDWQLGMVRRSLSEEAQARFTAARIDAVRHVAALADERACDFVVCAGDVFEHNALDRRLVVRALEAMRDFRVPLYLLPGNHDPLDAASIYRTPTFRRHAPDQVVVLDGSAAHTPVPGVEVHGAPWRSKRPLEDLVAAVCAPLGAEQDVLRVVVAHGAVDRGAPDPDDPALIGLAELEERITGGCVHYVALGDRHSCTEVGGGGRVRYAGAPEPTDFDEIDPGKVLVVDLSPSGCAVEAVPVASWRFLRRRLDLGSVADIDAVEEWLADQPAKDRTIARLSLVGTLTLREAAHLEAVLDHARDLYASLEVWEPTSDLAVLPDDGDFSDLALSGFAEQTLEDLRALAAGDGAEAEPARDALGLLYRLAGPATDRRVAAGAGSGRTGRGGRGRQTGTTAR